MTDQLSLFGASLYEPRISDLEGLLAGPGQLVRRDGTARLSVIVDAAWRARCLIDALAARGLEAESEERIDADAGGVVVRSGFAPELAPLAARWSRGAVKRPPPGLRLSDNQVWMWTVSAGHRDPAGFLLRLGPSDADAWRAIGLALAAGGLDADFVGSRAGGPGYRISSRRRVRRLRALVGEAPDGAVEWPE